MNWNKDKSITLTRLCLAVLAALLLVLDAGCVPIVKGFMRLRHMEGQLYFTVLLVTLLGCSLFGWPCLWRLDRLLRNIAGGNIFTAENVRHLRAVSWYCFGVCAICLFSTFFYLPFAVVTAAAAFMGLILRVLKNTFEQAVAMRDELDLTV